MNAATTTISRDRLRILYNDELELVGKVRKLDLELKSCQAERASELQQERPVVVDGGPSVGLIVALLVGAAVAGGVAGFFARGNLKL